MRTGKWLVWALDGQAQFGQYAVNPACSVRVTESPVQKVLLQRQVVLAADVQAKKTLDFLANLR